MTKQTSPWIFQKNLKRLVICRRDVYTKTMQTLLDDPDHFLAETQGPFFKNAPGDTTTIAVVTVDNRALVIKRYNIKSFWHGVKIRLRGTRAQQAWKYAHLLQRLEIPTITPVALVEKRFGPLRGTAYLISEYIEGTKGCEYFAAVQEPKAEWIETAKNIVQLIKQLKTQKLSHRDLHCGNMVIVDGKPLLLDLDHMHLHTSEKAFMRAHRKDVNLLLWYLERTPIVKPIFDQLLQE